MDAEVGLGLAPGQAICLFPASKTMSHGRLRAKVPCLQDLYPRGPHYRASPSTSSESWGHLPTRKHQCFAHEHIFGWNPELSTSLWSFLYSISWLHLNIIIFFGEKQNISSCNRPSATMCAAQQVQKSVVSCGQRFKDFFFNQITQHYVSAPEQQAVTRSKTRDVQLIHFWCISQPCKGFVIPTRLFPCIARAFYQ